jgi:ADP-ribose pyrophosphatase YjhB (NUDIX family)
VAWVGCDGIVIQNHCILLQKREDLKTWGQPGGGLEPGESLLDGVSRKVREETGLQVAPERLAAVHYRQWLGRDILVFSFYCRPVGGHLQTSNETLDVRYFGLDDLPSPTRGLSKQRLDQILQANGRFHYAVQNTSRQAQWGTAFLIALRTIRNHLQRRPPWHPAEFTIGAFATIWDEHGRVLLLHRRDRDAWNLPGGRVEKYESPWEACTREVREECGLESKVHRLTGIYAKPHKDEIVFNFDCGIDGGQLQSTPEADLARFFALDSLPGNLLPRQRERILDAAGRTPDPVIREQGLDWSPPA